MMAKKNKFKSFERDIEKKTVEENESILIICEGEKTEPMYFQSFEVYSATVKVLGIGRNTDSLVKYALQFKDDYDVIWCVFDKDSFSDQQFNNACQIAENNGMKVAYSNQSFELWYILHFNFLQSQLDRKQYIQSLNAIFKKQFKKEYKKNSTDTYKLLLFYQATAIANAKRLSKSYTFNSTPAQRFPSSYVYELVEQLNSLSRENRW